MQRYCINRTLEFPYHQERQATESILAYIPYSFYNPISNYGISYCGHFQTALDLFCLLQLVIYRLLLAAFIWF